MLRCGPSVTVVYFDNDVGRPPRLGVASVLPVQRPAQILQPRHRAHLVDVARDVEQRRHEQSPYLWMLTDLYINV